MDKEREGENGSRRGFLLFEILKLWVYLIENSESRGYGGDHTLRATTFGLSEYDNDQVLSVGFVLSVPLGFFMGLLRPKLGLAVERVYALGLSCALSELPQSSSFSSSFCINFPLEHL
ncbi:hypothetical protein HKD37_10G028660 [Glycine soja]